MQSRSENKTYDTTVMSRNGLNGSSSTSYVSNVVNVLRIDVTNGLVQGDKVTPNPFSFSIVEKMPGTFSTYQEWVETTGPAGTRLSSSSSVGLNHGYYNADIIRPAIPDIGPDLLDEAQRQMFGKIRDPANLIVDALESKTTLKMLKASRNVFRIARRVVRAARGDFSELSRLWLEARYGWMPSIHSMYDVMDNYFTVRSRNGVPVFGQSSRSRKFSKSSGSGSFDNPRISITTLRHDRYRIAGRFRVDNMSTFYDYTQLNPALIAWELLPLSFALDWIINVGQTLEAWENYFLLNQKWLGGYSTTTYLQDESVFVHGRSNSASNAIGTYRRQERTYSYKTRMKYKSRQVLPYLPQPGGLRFKPRFKLNQMLDSAALIRSAFR